MHSNRLDYFTTKWTANSCFHSVYIQSVTHQIGRKQGLEVEQQPSTGNLLEPSTASFLGLLKVLGVRDFLVNIFPYIAELRENTEKLSRELRKTTVS